jgi:penicillin-binding protein 2
MAIYQDNSELARRLSWIRVAIILVFVGIGLKLWHLTVVRYEHYRQLATQNRVRTLPLVAPRGLILDRNGEILVDNVFAFNLLLFRDEATNLQDTIQFLTSGVGINPEDLDERLDAAVDYPVAQPVLIKENLSMEDVAFLLAHRSERPELRTIHQPRRRYNFGTLASHLLGFVGEVSKEELETAEYESTKPGQMVGKAGIERVYHQHLTGTNGFRQVLVNHVGKFLNELRREEPVPGQELRLTIDYELQAIAEAELGQSPGAVVALNPKSGEILVMASTPGFDPNLFASRISAAKWVEMIEDPNRPFQNRAIHSTFAPGSTFKVIMALAGLESGVIDLESSVYCNGAINMYGRPFRCWKAGGHGRVALHEAIQHSCNVYFYVLGRKLGIDRIAGVAAKLGLGETTGIGLRGEVAGLLPSTEWKKKALGIPWYPGETISVAIGQGRISVTPLQLARAIGILATGEIAPLHLLRNPDQQMDSAPMRKTLASQNSDLAPIRQAMWSSVNEWGTGRGARVPGFEVCGKTGTAQTIGKETESTLSDEMKVKYVPNAWFTGFAPRHDPEIVIAVIIQRGGSGGSAAAPVAGKIFSRFYQKTRQDSVQGLEVALQN